jgi:aryl-alcohol dehydrogenase-like predicted oxidoreductase
MISSLFKFMLFSISPQSKKTHNQKGGRMQTRILGEKGPEVSTIGLGCMAMSEFYGKSDDAVSKKVILKALELGITMLDTADTYGLGHNETLIGKVQKEWPEEVFIATKFGIVRKPGEYARTICGKPEYVRSSVEGSLRRLQVEAIDLYYVHRIDQNVPIEETVGAMSDLVNEGKIKYIGLSEPSVATLLKAHGVHPITAVQSEYSLFTRDMENKLLPALRQNGIGFVPYSPLGRGFLTGKIDKERINQPDDFRQFLPRNQGDNYAHNMNLVYNLKQFAESKDVTPAQVALAWVLAKGEDIVPIPGTRHLTYLKENIAATNIRLSQEEIEQLETIFYPGSVMGERYTAEGMVGVNK